MMSAGDMYITKFGIIEVLKYTNKSNVLIKFVETGFEKVARYDHILSGSVKDGRKPTVFGVGYVENEITRTPNGRPLEYKYWSGMLQRSHCPKYKKLKNSYADCTSSEFFNSYSNFKNWCNSQIGFGNEGWNLDKDILVKGNKVYSEDVCVFVPQEINSLIVPRKSVRGEYPIGVTKHKKMTSFSSSVSIDGVMTYLGSYLTPEIAFQVYKKAKEDHIKVVANKWREKIDPRAYSALMNWTVEITD